jgi:PAS domain S-box-containing protein
MAFNNALRSKIIDAISEAGISASTQEIAKKVGLERHTLVKYLLVMAKENYLSYKDVGKAKIWFINKAPLDSIFSLSTENMTYSEKVLTQLIKNMPLGIMLLDESYKIQYMNSPLRIRYGDITGMPFYKDVMGHENPLKLDGFSKVMDNKTSRTEGIYVDAKDNILNIKVSKLRNPDASHSLIVLIEDITQKTKDERLLRESEERYRKLFETSPDGIVLMEADTTVLKANKGAFSIFGAKTEKDILGRKVSDYIPIESKENGEAARMKLIETGHLEPTMLSLHKKDGKKIHLEVSGTTFKDDKGNVLSLMAIVRDLTQRLKDQQAVKESEARYKTLVETSPDGIVMIGLDSIIQMVNSSFAALAGYKSKDELIGMKALDLVAPEDRKRAVGSLKDAASGKVVRTEHIMITKQNTKLPVEISTSALIDEKGSPSSLIVDVRDMSERKRLRKQREDIMRALDESSTVTITDPEGTITYANERMERQTGYSMKELIGSNPRILNSGYHPKEYWGKFWKTIKSGEIWRGEVRNKRKDGRLYWMHMTVVPLIDDEGNIEQFVTIRNDITPLKVLEERLRETTEVYEKILETMSEGIAIIDDDQKILFSDNKILRLLGYDDLEEVKGKRSIDLCHPKDRPILSARVKAIKDGNTVEPVNFWLKKKDGDYAYVRLNSSRLSIYEGRPGTYLLVAVRDLGQVSSTYDGIKIEKKTPKKNK